jgi:hypothetical protein
MAEDLAVLSKIRKGSIRALVKEIEKRNFLTNVYPIQNSCQWIL